MTTQEIFDKKSAIASVILDREAKLKEHDYVSAKIADGRATQGDYADTIINKELWAQEINAAREEIAELEQMTPDDDIIFYEKFDA